MLHFLKNMGCRHVKRFPWDSHGVPRISWQAVERPRPKEPKHRGLYPKGGVVPEIGSTVRHGGHGGISNSTYTSGSTNKWQAGMAGPWMKMMYFLLNMGKKFQQTYVRCTIFPRTSLVPVEKAGIFERFHDPIGWRISHQSKTKTRTPIKEKNTPEAKKKWLIKTLVGWII